MPIKSDAYRHHPELRDRITEPLGSFFRTFDIHAVFEKHPELEAARDWVHSDAERERARSAFLATHDVGDLWVFAYGSLMWDPAFLFAEVRRASVSGFSRRFILLDVNGGRGTRQTPGLMAALDHGGHCEGLAFRIAAGDIEAETEILWRREMVGPGYIPTFVEARIDDRPQAALTFMADHSAASVSAGLTREEQVRFIATGAGILGTSKAYLDNIVSHFAHLGIVDEDCSALLREVEDYNEAAKTTDARHTA